jgi:hypothetical protein
MLRHRGVFTSSTDKKELVSHFLLSYLTPDEFSLLLDSVSSREDSRKLRTVSHSIACDNPSLASVISSDFPIQDITQDQFGNSQVLGTPMWTSDAQGGNESYVLPYQVERKSYASDWTQSRRVFDAEIRLTLDAREKKLTIATSHTSAETEQTNRLITRSVERDFKEKKFIGAEPANRITFGSFNNQQRILFFMKFTGINNVPGIRFDKLTDLSLKLDESQPVPDQERLNWMRNKVRTLKLKGDALQETFFVTDVTCRPFVIFWKTELSFFFDHANESGRFTAVFEFDDYATREATDCEFQISIPNLSINGMQQGHPDCSHLKRQFAMRLNQEKERAYLTATAPQAEARDKA